MKECLVTGMAGDMCRGSNVCLALDQISRSPFDTVTESSVRSVYGGCPRMAQVLEVLRQNREKSSKNDS